MVRPELVPLSNLQHAASAVRVRYSIFKKKAEQVMKTPAALALVGADSRGSNQTPVTQTLSKASAYPSNSTIVGKFAELDEETVKEFETWLVPYQVMLQEWLSKNVDEIVGRKRLTGL